MKKVFTKISEWLFKDPWKLLIIFALLTVLILYSPHWLTKCSWYSLSVNTWTAQLGTTLSGTIGPLVALLAAFITFMAFWVQYEANRQIRKDTRIERFENKFYEMLKIHIDNVYSIEISNRHKGRKAFVKMFEEIRFIYSELLKIDHLKDRLDEIEDKEKCFEEKLIKIAYHHMFFGVDYESKLCNNPMGCEYQQISKVLSKRLRYYQRKFLKCKKKKLNEKYEYNHRGKHVKTFEPDFYPFDGYVSKLAHMYRHLYHMIKFVVREDWLDWRQKYDYLKMLRGQLSNHEQAIMFFNIIWIDDEDEHNWWIDKKAKDQQSYLLDYAILKNLPFNLAKQLGPDPLKYYSEKLDEFQGPYYKGLKNDPADNKEISKDEKLQWLFEWNN